MPRTSKLKLNDRLTRIHQFVMFGYVFGLYPALYFDKPNIAYIIFMLISIGYLFVALVADRIIWHVTIGNRVDIDMAQRMYNIVYNPLGVIKTEVDESYIRNYLCLSLRRRDMKLSTVKELFEIFPGYISISDRDGMSPFELACRFSSLDIVRYILELDEKMIDYVDDSGNTPLHWACQRKTYVNPSLGGSIQGLDVVNYLLEKRMSLVTVANKDGDLPIHLASYRMKTDPDRVGRSKWNWTMAGPERIEIVLRLLLAYPDCLNCAGGGTSSSSGKENDKKKNR